MEKLREWSFPAALIALWMLAAAYTVSLMIEAPGRSSVLEHEAPPAAESTEMPAS